METNRDEETSERLRIDRRTLLKGAVAAGVAGAAYAAPVVSVVPAYGATSLVSYTVESGPVCIWFSPNQSNFGQWHLPNGDVNNYNPVLGTNVGNGGWTCWPPAAQMPVVVNGVTRYVNFVGVPDDWVGTPSGTCTDGATGQQSTVTSYTMINAETPWTGGGVQIFLDPSTMAGCEINVSGTVGGVQLGPYCEGSCNTPPANSQGMVPATWAQGSSTSPIGTNTLAKNWTTLTTALAKNSTYTSIDVAALPFPVAVGDPISIGGQTTHATAAAAAGSTTIQVQSFTAGAAYAVGTPVFDTTELSTALVKSTVYTSIDVVGLTSPVAIGDPITIGPVTGTYQTTYATAAAAAGSTTIQVQSFTANAAYAVGTDVTHTTALRTALVKNTTYTSIDVAGLTSPVAIGDAITIGALNGTFQTVYASAAASAGAASIAVTSFVAAANFAVGQPVIDTGKAPGGNVGGGVFRSAYYHTGQGGRNSGSKCSFALFFDVRCRS